jgi:hypothetical protein
MAEALQADSRTVDCRPVGRAARLMLTAVGFAAGIYAANRMVAREARKIVQPPRRWTRA